MSSLRNPSRRDHDSAGPAVEPTGAQTRLWRVGLLATLGLTALSLAAVASAAGRKLAHPLNTDFGVFYAAGKLAASGHLLAAYATSRLNHVEVAAGGRALHLFYPYPPFVTAFLSLLSHMSPGMAFSVWTVVNVLAYVGAGALVVRSRSLRRERVLASLAVVGCLPLLVSVAQGEN